MNLSVLSASLIINYSSPFFIQINAKNGIKTDMSLKAALINKIALK